MVATAVTVVTLMLPWVSANTNAIGIELNISISPFALLNPRPGSPEEALQIPALLISLVTIAGAGMALAIARRLEFAGALGLPLQITFGLEVLAGSLLIFAMLTVDARSGLGLGMAILGMGPGIGLFAYIVAAIVGLLAMRRIARLSPVMHPDGVSTVVATSSDIAHDNRRGVYVAGLLVVGLVLAMIVVGAMNRPSGEIASVPGFAEPTIPVVPEATYDFALARSACESGDMATCDQLYQLSAAGTEDETFARTCGYRTSVDQDGNCVARAWEAVEEPAAPEPSPSAIVPAIQLPGRAEFEAMVKQSYDAYYRNQYRLGEVVDLALVLYDDARAGSLCVEYSYVGLQQNENGTDAIAYPVTLTDGAWMLGSGEEFHYGDLDGCMAWSGWSDADTVPLSP